MGAFRKCSGSSSGLEIYDDPLINLKSGGGFATPPPDYFAGRNCRINEFGNADACSVRDHAQQLELQLHAARCKTPPPRLISSTVDSDEALTNPTDGRMKGMNSNRQGQKIWIDAWQPSLFAFPNFDTTVFMLLKFLAYPLYLELLVLQL